MALTGNDQRKLGQLSKADGAIRSEARIGSPDQHDLLGQQFGFEQAFIGAEAMEKCHIDQAAKQPIDQTAGRALDADLLAGFTCTELLIRSGTDQPNDRFGAAQTTMVGRFGARSRVREGDQAEVAVDTRALHFFDPETGLGIYERETTKGAQ